MTIEVEIGGRRRAVSVRRMGDGWAVEIDGRDFTATLVEAGGRWSLLARSGAGDATPPRSGSWCSYEVAFESAGDGAQIVYVDGTAMPLVLADPRMPPRRRGRDATAAGPSGPATVVAPMPGRIVKVLVEPGAAVTARQGLVVVEAMKMENELRAPRAGTVREVRVSEGMSVEAKTVLVVIE